MFILTFSLHKPSLTVKWITHILNRERRFFLLDSHVSSNVWNMLKNILMLRKKKYKKGADPHLKLKPTDTTFVIIILFF